MREITVRHLAAGQRKAWTFDLGDDPAGGGIVSVPAKDGYGYPIDWPPQNEKQAAWILEFAPNATQKAGCAWFVKKRRWARLVARLEAQRDEEAG